MGSDILIAAAKLPPTPPRSQSPSDDGRDCISPENRLDIPLPPPSNPQRVLDIDLNTPDKHVPRDPQLIRLTGVHPFNVEAPLSSLYDAGFLTPSELFYVRNHGAVPEIQKEGIEDWEVSIEGLVETPIKLSLKEVMGEFQQVTVPITLVCAGNRRKEQNMVRKSNGFSWGAAGISNSLWTGPMLWEVLQKAKPMRNGRYLCMEGADPLPNGHYGTSIKMSWAMNNERGIMLAYKQNGEVLTPDHGYPLRVVIPGVIGGRSVKWLKRLIVTDKPSDNWYHEHDNRVLPTMVTPNMAKHDQSWWQDERYAIYDLSVNSAIVYPAHEETLSVQEKDSNYTIRGYAYTGGMRRVTRVEISFDKGQTWELSNIEYPEDKYRKTEQELYGGRLDMQTRDACYCWCFWSLDTTVATLHVAEDILVRAMDDSMNIQPRDTYWSVLGMMHNAWFRVAIRKGREGSLYFEHPTQPALQPGGWMERVKKEGGNLMDGKWGEKVVGQREQEVSNPVVEEIRMTNDAVKRVIQYEELKAHEAPENPWFVVDGEVYDGTAFLEGHPGGATSIIAAGGTDATEEFKAIHSEVAKAMMSTYHIGTLSESGQKALTTSIAPVTVDDSKNFLNPRAWKKSSLIKKKIVSWDTRIFTFQLDSPTQSLGLPIGQHILLKLKDEKTGEVIVRAYTPVSRNEPSGTVDLLVKVYFQTDKTAGGKMTMALERLLIGQTLELKGPLGKLEYLGRGEVLLGGEKRTVGSFLMVCGGSGITPIFQILRAVMEDKEDTTRCVVLNGNRLEEDILCKEELDGYINLRRSNLKLIHTLTQPTDSWMGRKGRINRELVAAEAPEDQPMALICGPEAMEKGAHKILKELGWQNKNIVFF